MDIKSIGTYQVNASNGTTDQERKREEDRLRGQKPNQRQKPPGEEYQKETNRLSTEECASKREEVPLPRQILDSGKFVQLLTQFRSLPKVDIRKFFSKKSSSIKSEVMLDLPKKV